MTPKRKRSENINDSDSELKQKIDDKHISDEQFESERSYLRYPPYKGEEIGLVSLNLEEFVVHHVGLIVEQSAIGGCGLVMVNAAHLVNKTICKVKIGDLNPVRAEVRWKKDLEKNISVIGFQFLE